jgi:hypothetical protein
MNALKARRRYDAEQADLAWKKRQEEEQAKIDAMTDDERATYLAEKEHRRRNAMQLLGVMNALSAGPYSTQAAKDFIHLMHEADKNN